MPKIISHVVSQDHTQAQRLLDEAAHQRTYGTASGIAGLVGGVTAGLMLPAVGVIVGLIGVAFAAKMLVNAEGKEKQASLMQQQDTP